MIRTIPESVHALLSPSKAHMWSQCTGALGAAKGMPNSTSKYAAEGTVYHDVARRALLEDQPCSAYIGDHYEVAGFPFIVDEENADYAQQYVDAVRAIPGKRFVEVDLEYSRLLGVPKMAQPDLPQSVVDPAPTLPVASGTGDCVVVDFEHETIHSHDLKFGRGDIVYACELQPNGTKKPNAQLALYAIAAVAKFELLGIEDHWKVSMAIHQPRAHHYDSHEMTVGELRAWVLSIKDAANRAYVLWTWGPERITVGTDLTPGEKQCRWCPLSGNCKAQADKMLAMFPKTTAAVAITNLITLPDEELAEALDRADEVEHWISAVRAHGLARARSGHVLPNWKVVIGRKGNREMEPTNTMKLDVATATEIGIEDIDDPEYGVDMPIATALDFALGKRAYAPAKLLTVAKLQPIVSKQYPLFWAALQEHITQSDGNPSLERMEDPRPPITNLGAEFPVAPEAGALPNLV